MQEEIAICFARATAARRPNRGDRMGNLGGLALADGLGRDGVTADAVASLAWEACISAKVQTLIGLRSDKYT
jgi:hypothetical protein